MNIEGKIIIAFPEMSGTSKAGNAWKKREYVLETVGESFPRKVHFDFFGERADQYPLQVGDVINLSFDIESREYNGRWYTSIRGWKAEPAAGAAAQAAQPAAYGAGISVPPASSAAPVPPIAPANDSEDLPF